MIQGGLRIETPWDKADQPQFTPGGEGLWAGECARPLQSEETSAPLCFGLYQLADGGPCKCWPDQNGAETGTILFRKKERKHLWMLPWCRAGPSLLLFLTGPWWASSWPIREVPWNKCIWKIFSIPLQEMLVFSHPYYMGWVSKLSFNHSCFQMVS